MTDLDRDERIRRLQERRAAGREGPTPAPGAETAAGVAALQERSAGVDDGSAPAARRHHPAAASRVGAAGLGATVTLSLVGAMALANRTPASSETAQQPSTISSVPVVLVPIRHTFRLVTATGGSGNWTGMPGAAASVNVPGAASAQTQSSSTNGSK